VTSGQMFAPACVEFVGHLPSRLRQGPAPDAGDRLSNAGEAAEDSRPNRPSAVAGRRGVTSDGERRGRLVGSFGLLRVVFGRRNSAPRRPRYLSPNRSPFATGDVGQGPRCCATWSVRFPHHLGFTVVWSGRRHTPEDARQTSASGPGRRRPFDAEPRGRTAVARHLVGERTESWSTIVFDVSAEPAASFPPPFART